MEYLDQVIYAIPNWKWLATVAALFLGWMLRPIFRLVIRQLKSIPQRLQANKSTFMAHFIELPVEKPLASFLVGALWIISINAIGLPEGFKRTLMVLVSLWLVFHIVCLFFIVVDAGGLLVIAWARRTQKSMDEQIVSFAKRTLKIVIAVLGVLVFLQNQDIDVMALLAGLSLGGIALALAAQDTFANLFGSITIFF